MARKIRDRSLDSREARSKLAARGKPYWRGIERGVHLGYRRLKGKAGTWCVRHYVGDQTYTVESLGAADDLSDADGVAILDFWQAQTKVREDRESRAHKAAGKTGPLTVGQVMEDYIAFQFERRKSGQDARYRYEAFIKPAFGDLEVNALTKDQISAWHGALAKKAPRIRTAKGAPQKHRELGKDAESVRQRRNTANRTLCVLRAALNRAWRDGKVSSDAPWRRIEPFENAGAARIRHLTMEEAKRLINASEPDFRLLVQAALQTGCRYGELARLQVRDFNPDAGTLAVTISKTGKSRHVVLTHEGIAFFKQLCAGRSGGELMLSHNGSPWGTAHQTPYMRRACVKGKISPLIGFHGFWDTWEELHVIAGVPLLVVGRNLGHVDARMVEKHYGHLSSDYIAEAIRAGAPQFGFKPDAKLATLAGRG